MCTVTYLPSENEGFILTSNRDEQASRPSAFMPDFLKINQIELLAPIDAKAKGTWIATASHRTVCLLNGALMPHIPKQKYRQSRGLVVLDVFKYASVPSFLEDYDLFDIEPFTLVIVEHHPRLLTELIWDGTQKVINQKNPAASFIWSSVTLYSPAVVAQRKQWFEEFLLEHQETYQQSKIIDFHRFGGTGDTSNDILMNRNNQYLTVSITSIFSNLQYKNLRYFDLLNGEDKQIELNLV